MFFLCKVKWCCKTINIPAGKLSCIFKCQHMFPLCVYRYVWCASAVLSSQVDGGLSGWGVASHHRAGGGAQERRLSGQTGQLLRPAHRLPQEDLWPRADTLQGEKMRTVLYISGGLNGFPLKCNPGTVNNRQSWCLGQPLYSGMHFIAQVMCF